MKTVDQLMTEAFSVPRAPRSPEYKAGVRAVLDYRINGKVQTFPYPSGTAAADAFYAGTREGHDIWKRETR